MGAGLKSKIVLSGVNFTGMGPLKVFRDAIASLAVNYSDKFEIIALVHRKSLFDIPNVTFHEYPTIKSSWFKRLNFEYRECRRISEEIRPHLWLAMHDMTPNVKAEVQAVYCHNPSPFYSFRAREALLDWKFGLFTLLYRFLYRINIKSNDFVVVQQEWMRSEFQSRYGVRNIIVAHPPVEMLSVAAQSDSFSRLDGRYRFFYPAFPRTFKNLEVILEAARILEKTRFRSFEVWLTMAGRENRYAAKLREEYSDLTTIQWLGLLPPEEVQRRYHQADCLLFPSRLETWGLPITEFKATGKPICAADLPYAHETMGQYPKAVFFDPASSEDLGKLMRAAAVGENVFAPATEYPIAMPSARNWEELWQLLLQHDGH